jgi:hypothetical protein
LAEDDILDKTYRDAILSRQNRLEIKDEDVQFGTIAVREGHVSQEAVDQALEINSNNCGLSIPCVSDTQPITKSVLLSN